MKNIRKVLNKLDSTYTTKPIDVEECIHKVYGNYDIEVSGLDNMKRDIKGYVFIWRMKDYIKVKTKVEYNNEAELLDILHKLDIIDIELLVNDNKHVKTISYKRFMNMYTIDQYINK